MDNLTYSKVKVYSITYFIMKKYNFTPLIFLYKDYLQKRLSNKQYLMILLLCESYKRKNIFKNTVLYNFIEYYLKNNNSAFFNKLIFDLI
jgi:hypothetical protein